jgi:hypothetical protein
MEDRAYRESVRILLAGGWQVVPARANDDFAELWRTAGRRGTDEDQPFVPRSGATASIGTAAGPAESIAAAAAESDAPATRATNANGEVR